MIIRYDAAQGKRPTSGQPMRQRPIENNPNSAAENRPKRPPSKPPSNRPESEFNQRILMGNPSKPKAPVNELNDRRARERVNQGLSPQKLSAYHFSDIKDIHSHLENHPGANPSHASHQEWKSHMGMVKSELKKRSY